MVTKRVSVIVPVCNVAPFVGRCMQSLAAQTLTGIEVVVVDDCGTDGSMDIVERHAATNGNIRIVRHNRNRGLAAARNTGLSVATGDYIVHCDGDDWMEPDALERLYITAIRTRADVVWCDYAMDYDGGTRIMSQLCNPTPEGMMRAMLSGRIKYNVWNKLARRDLYEGLSFPEGDDMGEDMTMLAVCARARRVAHVLAPLYHYVQSNGGALTKSMDAHKLAQIKRNADKITERLRGQAAEADLMLFKLATKLPLLTRGSHDEYRQWRQWYPEANAHIWADRDISLRTRLLQQMAAWGQYWYVWAYCRVVLRMMYRLTYR